MPSLNNQIDAWFYGTWPGSIEGDPTSYGFAFAAKENLKTILNGTPTQVADANYSATIADRIIEYTSITAARVVTLPSAASFPQNTLLQVVDASGNCTSVKSITLVPFGADTVNGAGSQVITAAYGYMTLQPNVSGTGWILVETSAQPVVYPAGGIPGQALTKNGYAQGAVTWSTLPVWNNLTGYNALIGVDSYNSGFTTGYASWMSLCTDNRPQTNQERYGGWSGISAIGTGDYSVGGTQFAFGASAIKTNWATTGVLGQTVGQNIVVRGGYTGSTTPPSGYSYQPGGDTAGIVANVVCGSQNNFVALFEGVVYSTVGGAINSTAYSMDVQLGAIYPNGGNNGIGLVLTAQSGGLGAAINISGPSNRSSTWNKAFQYNWFDGSGNAYAANTINQDGSVTIAGGPQTANSVTIRVGGSVANCLEFVTPATAGVAMSMDAYGNLNCGLIFSTITPTFDTTAAGITYSAGYILDTVLTRYNTGAVTDTFPTAAAILAAISEPRAGNSWQFMIRNGNTGTLTLAGNTGITTSGTMTIASNFARRFTAYIASLSPAAITIYSDFTAGL